MVTFTAEQVQQHNKADDCWIIVHGKVYDVTKFLSQHPGGKKILLNEGGKDASAKFDQFHKREVLQQYANLCIGEVAAAAAPAKKASPKQDALLFGEQIPYGDPLWYQGLHSPFYNDSHRRFRQAVREWVDAEITPYTFEWDEAKKIPRSLLKKAYEAGILPGAVGFWPTEFVGDKIAGGVKPSEWDHFHELIAVDEICRPGSGGIGWFLVGSLAIALPPVIQFGSKYIKDKVVKPCLTGEKIISLCITEPRGGSDVANTATEARKTPDGKYYIVNGEKKWITNGVNADFYTVAVRTGDKGMGGISMLLIERDMPGVTAKQMQCTGVWPSGTSYITFEDVKVPVENLIGKENEGFKLIMSNFNHERWGVVIETIRLARVCYEEAFKYAHKRKTFGKLLIENPIIRAKLGNMARQIESTYAWLEILTFQMNKMSAREAAEKLGGPLALLKVQATQILTFCATEAANVFGGLGYSRGGQAEKVERIYRDARAFVIGGGTEEILLDLGVRQASKQFVPNSKL